MMFEVSPRYGTKTPCSGTRGREGEFRKDPSDNHRERMVAHVRMCTHGDCNRVWNGPWGTFIGGAQGSTHFDLTECATGRRLNEQIGWNHGDPRC